MRELYGGRGHHRVGFLDAGTRLLLIGGLAAAALATLVMPAPAADVRVVSTQGFASGNGEQTFMHPDVKVILPAERELKAERPDGRMQQIYGGSGLAGPALGKVTAIGGKMRVVSYRPSAGTHHLTLVPS